MHCGLPLKLEEVTSNNGSYGLGCRGVYVKNLKMYHAITKR